MRRLILKSLLLLPILAAMAIVNLTVDPGGVFGSGLLESRLTSELLRGNSIIKPRDFNDRVFLRLYATKISRNIQVLVLGSSRSMMISGDIFPGLNLYNASVNGVSLEDILAIHQIFYENGIQPAKILIEVDPDIFNRNHGKVWWQTLIPEYQRAMLRLGLESDLKTEPRQVYSAPKYVELLSPAFLQESITTLIRRWRSKGKFNPTKYPDGSEWESHWVRNRTVEEVRSLANMRISVADSALNDFHELDPGLLEIFESFVRSLQDRGTEVVFFLPPFHPLSYKRMISSEQYVIVSSVENYIRSFARSRNIRVFGSYDPERISFTEQDFVDGSHIKREAVPKIFSSHGG